MVGSRACSRDCALCSLSCQRCQAPLPPIFQHGKGSQLAPGSRVSPTTILQGLSCSIKPRGLQLARVMPAACCRGWGDRAGSRGVPAAAGSGRDPALAQAPADAPSHGAVAGRQGSPAAASPRPAGRVGGQPPRQPVCSAPCWLHRRQGAAWEDGAPQSGVAVPVMHGAWL